MENIPDTKTTSTRRDRLIKAHIGVVQRYLKQEFPGQMRCTWWDRNLMAQVFEVVHGPSLRHIVVDVEFFLNCSDCAVELRDSELADYIRESQSPARCFLVKWRDGGIRIRSKPL
jgi:hypothetical protein